MEVLLFLRVAEWILKNLFLISKQPQQASRRISSIASARLYYLNKNHLWSWWRFFSCSVKWKVFCGLSSVLEKTCKKWIVSRKGKQNEIVKKVHTWISVTKSTLVWSKCEVKHYISLWETTFLLGTVKVRHMFDAGDWGNQMVDSFLHQLS